MGKIIIDYIISVKSSTFVSRNLLIISSFTYILGKNCSSQLFLRPSQEFYISSKYAHRYHDKIHVIKKNLTKIYLRIVKLLHIINVPKTTLPLLSQLYIFGTM